MLKKLRIALLAGAVALGFSLTARAQEEKKEQPKEELKVQPKEVTPAPCPGGTVGAAGAVPAGMRRVLVSEMVPETYQATRTVYRMQERQETYTAYRTETVPETRTRTVTVNVPVCEERTVMQSHWTCKPVCHVERKCVDRGHYECREVPCEPGLLDRLRDWGKKRKNNCCDPCADPCANACPPRTKTVRVWVPCPVWEEKTVTKMERVCEQRPVKVQVTTCRKECRTETYTVNVCRQVPYQATRCVKVCVPCQETYTACRMVCRQVEKLVPACDDACAAACCCESSSGRGRLSGLLGRLCGRRSSCCD
jgi:hypothetical protein